MTGSYGMNDLGQVVGEYFVSGDIYPKGFIYTFAESHGTYTPFTVKDAISTTLNDINDAGDLVGAYRGTTGKFPLGGNHQDRGTALGLDQHDNVYVTGYNASNDFPLQDSLYNALKPFDPQDGFVVKIHPYSLAMQVLLLILENLPQ